MSEHTIVDKQRERYKYNYVFHSMHLYIKLDMVLIP